MEVLEGEAVSQLTEELVGHCSHRESRGDMIQVSKCLLHLLLSNLCKKIRKKSV